MAKDEMQMITEDRWGEEIWGVAHDMTPNSGILSRPSSSARLIFYFGKEVCIPYAAASSPRITIAKDRCVIECARIIG